MLVRKQSGGLYDPSYEHDACGIGFVANIKGNKSHAYISDALTVLENMEHRGACGCENNTGDGAGIMLQVPHEFFFDECLKLGVHLPAVGRYGVGCIFFPKEIRLREECRAIFNRSAEKLGLEVATSEKEGSGSTDMGNVSQALPSIQPYLAIAPAGVSPHTIEFREAAGSDVGQQAMLNAAKAMALTALDLLVRPGLLDAAKAEFADLAAKGVVKGM